MSTARRRIRTAIGLTTLAMALAAPPSAAPAADIVAPGPNGTAHFAWTDYGASPAAAIKHRRLLPNGAFGTTQVMSPTTPDAVGQRIGVDAAGNAVIAWVSEVGQGQLVKIRRRTPAGVLSATQTLSPSGIYAFGHELAVEPDGDAIAIWLRAYGSHQIVQARRRAADGTLGPTHTLSYLGATAHDATVAVAPTGAATVAWLRSTSAGSYVQTRTISNSGTLSTTQSLSSTTARATPPKVTVDDQGVATIAWVRRVGDIGSGFYRLRSANGTLGAPVEFATNVVLDNIAVATNGDGRTAFAWLKDDPAGDRTRGRFRTVGTGLGAAFDVGGSGVQDRRPAVGMDDDGQATFAWHEQVDDNGAIRVRRTRPGGWGPLRVVSTRPSSAPYLAVDAFGKATVAWFDTGLLARTVSPDGTMSPAVLRVDG